MSEPLIPNAPGWWVLQSGPDLWCIEVRDAPPNGLWYPIPAFHDDGLFVELFGDLAALAADTGGRWLGMVTPDLFGRVVAEDAARLSAELAQARADLEAAQATVNAVAEVVAQLRGDVLDTEACGEDLAAPANGGLLARVVAQMRADLEAAQDRLTLYQLRAELHHLATSTSPDADRCADALAALVEPLAPPPDTVIRWLKGRGWRTDGVGAIWQTMRRGSRGLVDVPLRVGSRDYARCVAGLVGEVAIVEGVRRSRMAVDLWAAMLASPAPT